MTDFITERATDFNSTEVTFKPQTQRAREVCAELFGRGAVSFNTPMSHVWTAALELEKLGYKVDVR